MKNIPFNQLPPAEPQNVETFKHVLIYGLVWLTSMFGALFFLSIVFK